MSTLVEVGRLAGVTPATVSNVLRGRGRVSEATRERVLAAVQQLGYRPNLNARALVEGRPHTIALIVSSIANPFYPEFALAAEKAVRKHDYFLLVCNTNNDPAQEAAYLDAVGGSLAQGVLVMNADFVRVDELLALRRRGVPVVLCMWEKPDEAPDLPYIAVDFHQAGVIAAEHLLKLGHTRIGAIVGSEPTGNHIWRYRGFCDALARAGVPHPPDEVRFGGDTIDAGRNAAHALLAAVPDLSAIFVSNDLPAIGVLQAAADLGLEVPADLSVIGITDIQLAHQVRPALTTVAVPTEEAAELAVQLMMQVIEDGAQQIARCAVASTPQLVVRASTGRVRRARKSA
ncbi:LacI family DNA-binding transcriptional regulator [Niveibacterium umoris]|uniref:DNA-binding LacI/PurR family transcriptional regulator n=1 Tax=Niveibacterium umoris TaxID=1193620 RepID=A0A840BRW6_9RHOO|nr:LacI family DNA-binding transcriptional regulator [Niveibacterium umoris]MBB4013137.1 DNA-binding LacI/PurR family transcriptional regulator [Niveibacterium umoris]